MKNDLITILKEKFDKIAEKIPDTDVEYWFARDLQIELGYVQWRNFLEVIEKAKTACSVSCVPIDNHFADVSKMVKLGLGVERQIEVLTKVARKVKSDEKKMIKNSELPNDFKNKE